MFMIIISCTELPKHFMAFTNVFFVLTRHIAAHIIGQNQYADTSSQ